MANFENPPLDADFLRAFFDTVIPASGDGRMAGAGSLGIEASVMAAIESDERSGESILAGMTAVASQAFEREPAGFATLTPAGRAEVVEGVVLQHPRLMNAFARHLYLAYYQHPQVLAAIGEPPRPPFPEGFTIEPTDPDLMAKLLERRVGRLPSKTPRERHRRG